MRLHQTVPSNHITRMESSYGFLTLAWKSVYFFAKLWSKVKSGFHKFDSQVWASILQRFLQIEPMEKDSIWKTYQLKNQNGEMNCVLVSAMNCCFLDYSASVCATDKARALWAWPALFSIWHRKNLPIIGPCSQFCCLSATLVWLKLSCLRRQTKWKNYDNVLDIIIM